jgi:hypothetical protein
MGSEYRYIPLSNLPDDTIRLLQLHRGHTHEKIKCNLSTAKLTLRPAFAAVSYVWGTEPASEEIELDGKPFYVRKNLWQCLVRLREPNRPLTLWIDAICVNQRDIDERNQQVRFMNHIFGTAKPVFAWLGEDVAKGCVELQQNLIHFRTELLTDMYFIRLTSVDDLYTLLHLGRAILDVCKSAYWSRMWIVQEIIVAQKLLMCFGSQRVSWQDLKRCCFVLHDGVEPFGDLCEEVRAHEVIKQCRISLHSPGISTFITQGFSHSNGPGAAVPPPLYELIEMYKTKECSDLRDKVYALLGLRKYSYVHRLRDRPPLQADYKKSTADLFFDVMLQEGLPNAWFADSLRQTLCLEMHELEQASLSRGDDTFLSRMIHVSTVEEALYSKIETSTTSDNPSYTQFILMNIDVQPISPEPNSFREDLEFAYTAGDRVVKANDLIFKLEHSPILFAFRYERCRFQPIARVHKFHGHQFQGCLGHYPRPRRISLKEIYAPTDFETWRGSVQLEYGPDVLLEVLRYKDTRTSFFDS